MKLRNLSILLIVLLLLTSCNKNSGNKGVELELTVLPATVTDSLYVKMSYRYGFTEKFSPSQLSDEYRVFVHLWRMKNKEMLLQDDHNPTTPISQWKAGQPVDYSRVIFIPQFLDEFDIDFEGYEEVKLTVGLYKPGDEENKIVLYQKVLNVQAASLNAPEMVYDEGWNQPETNAKIENPEVRNWRWTKKKAVCIIENPRKDSLLIIRGGVDKDKFKDQSVTIKVNDTLLETFIPETSKFSKRFVVAAEQMGGEDEFKLIIETDKTFIPSQLDEKVNDDRVLGVQVFFLYFREHIK
ncbi:MAG: hypothetical protein GY940_29545 [bacterium]|nr:hypothetical protein [bacterium]